MELEKSAAGLFSDTFPSGSQDERIAQAYCNVLRWEAGSHTATALQNIGAAGIALSYMMVRVQPCWALGCSDVAQQSIPCPDDLAREGIPQLSKINKHLDKLNVAAGKGPLAHL